MKILYVATLSNTINAFLIPHIESLLRRGYEVDIACNIKRELSSEIKKNGCRVFNVNFSRSPISRNNLKAYREIKEIIENNNYDIVHVHTPIASTITRLAKAKKTPKIIYTAHGFHFFKGAPFINWLTYFPIEKKLSYKTDCIITVNREDFMRSKKNFKSALVRYMPGVGLDISKIKNTNVNRLLKREELNIHQDSFVVLSVGEINKNKNHEVIIKALSLLQNPKIIYLVCGVGPIQGDLIELARKLSVSEQVKFLGFRTDIIEICKASDVFAFPSKREGLGMAALEAMASGLPIITSNIHGINDYSIDGITGFSYSSNDYRGFAEGIYKLYSEPVLRRQIKEYNKKKVMEYDLKNSLDRLNSIYDEITERCISSFDK